MELVNSSDGKINGGLGSVFQVTLDGTNGTLKFINFTKGQSFTLILKQDSSGSRTVTFPSGITWQAGQSPNMQTAAGATDVFQFVCTGTGTFRDVSGAPSKLPAKIIATVLGTMLIAGAGITGVTFSLTRGNGESVGALPNACRVVAQSGALILSVCDGSGSWVAGKYGGLGVGVVAPGTTRLDNPSNSGSWLPNGNLRTRGTMTIKNTMSAATLQYNVPAAGIGNVLCPKTDGTIGYMIRTSTGFVKSICN